MGRRLIDAAARNGILAVAFYALMAYRDHARGQLGPRRLGFMAAFLGLTFVVATTWQVTRRIEIRSWWTSFLGFILSLVAVSVTTVAVLAVLLRLR